MKTPSRFGRSSEALAAAYLRGRGYRIVERNYRTSLGEIDIIARDGDTIAFVEVKARRSRRYGPAKGALTATKRRTICRVAQLYLKATGQSGVRARFDVVAIDAAAREARIELIQNAFPLVS